MPSAPPAQNPADEATSARLRVSFGPLVDLLRSLGKPCAGAEDVLEAVVGRAPALEIYCNEGLVAGVSYTRDSHDSSVPMLGVIEQAGGNPRTIRRGDRQVRIGDVVGDEAEGEPRERLLWARCNPCPACANGGFHREVVADLRLLSAPQQLELQRSLGYQHDRVLNDWRDWRSSSESSGCLEPSH